MRLINNVRLTTYAEYTRKSLFAEDESKRHEIQKVRADENKLCTGKE